MTDTKLTPAQRRVIDNLKAGRNADNGFTFDTYDRELLLDALLMLLDAGLLVPTLAVITEKGKSV